MSIIHSKWVVHLLYWW